MIEAPHALYRFHGGGRLLYVGITLDPGSRWRSHRKGKPWWHEVDRIEVETHPTREAVLAAERAAIIAEGPAYNVVHNRGGARVEEVLAVDMPDVCEECLDAWDGTGPAPLSMPFAWHEGVALYVCPRGRGWSCGWGHLGTGIDTEGVRRANAVIATHGLRSNHAPDHAS